MSDMGINAQTIIVLAVIAVLFVFALKHAVNVFGGKTSSCHGGGGTARGKRIKAVTVEDTDESHYPYRTELTVGGMTCDHCRQTVEHSINAIPGVWARIDLDSRKAVVLSKNPIEQNAVESAVEDAGYYVIRQPTQPA